MTTSGLKTVNLTLPASTDELRKLEIGTVVYLKGRVFTAREGVYKRAVEDGVPLPVPPAMPIISIDLCFYKDNENYCFKVKQKPKTYLCWVLF